MGTPLPLHFWLWSQLPLLPLNMEVMAIVTTSLDKRNPYKEDIQNAKSFGRKSKGSTMKKKKRKNATMSKYPSKIPKLNVILKLQNSVKTNGFALIIPNKKILITARTKNGSQPTITARNLKKNIAMTFPLLDTRIKKNAHGNTNGFLYKLEGTLPSESALTNHHMNTTATKSRILISLVISF